MDKRIEEVALVWLDRFTRQATIVSRHGREATEYTQSKPIKELLNELDSLGFVREYDTRPEDNGSYQLWVRYVL